MSEEGIFDDVEPTAEGTTLEKLSELVSVYKDLEAKIVETEETLSRHKKELEDVSRNRIPTILNSTGLSEIRLSTGEKLKVEDKVQASITNANYTLAYRNMINAEGGDDDAVNKVDSLFKSQVILEDVSDKVLDLLLENEIAYDTKRSIHPATLKKYCKGLLEEGKAIPEGISVFQYQETKITIK